jgi:hypothetical protein
LDPLAGRFAAPRLRREGVLARLGGAAEDGQRRGPVRLRRLGPGGDAAALGADPEAGAEVADFGGDTPRPGVQGADPVRPLVGDERGEGDDGQEQAYLGCPSGRHRGSGVNMGRQPHRAQAARAARGRAEGAVASGLAVNKASAGHGVHARQSAAFA